METPGQIVDHRFVLETEHKRGGMGTVWKGRDLRTERRVAIKVLLDRGQAERFDREGGLLADLRHPNVVGYVGHGTTPDGLPYLAMEWLDGENVAERLERAPLTLRESLTLVRGAAEVLAVAHGRGVVHRDLKPSNLFLRGGRIDDVVLLDLGIARQLAAASDLTRTGSILGTPSYMAPEQAQGQTELGPAADVFSLGCLLFECLAGEVPFAGTHVFSVLAKVVFEEAPRLDELRPEVPAAVAALVARMLSKDPRGRPADAAALLAALGKVEPGPDLAAPRAAPAASVVLSAEQELVSVILVTRADAAAAEPELPDLTMYSGELKRLADGTAVITFAQRAGSATDLAARAARCARRLRQSGWTLVVATGRGIPRVHLGEAVDRAGAMLREVAGQPGGSIWVDELTAGLLDARFDTARAEPGHLLLGEDASIDPGRRLLGRPTTCVGRDHELAMMELALRACVEESTPRALLLVGPAGIGKSRLRHELIRQIRGRGDPPTVLLGMGDPIRTTDTRGLLGGALARLCGVRPDQSAEENRAALEARLALDGQPEARRTVVFMGELCGARYPPDTLPELAVALQNPTIMADLLTQAWLTFARIEAARRPLLLVLDDLQWCDDLTVGLVGTALRTLTTSPLMVLALARPEVTELYPDLWAPRLTTLPLPPLGAAATARLVRQVLGAEISDASVQRIVGQAGGNALYVEELIRAAEAKRDAVPGTVLAMLQARIGLLPPGARRVLRAASVFGEDFPLAGVEALLGSAEDLPATLALLGRHEILEHQPDERGGRRWRFRHALMRDAAYDLSTAEDLAAWHLVAARTLESAGDEPAVVASHYERGGDGGRAVGHYVTAAERAYHRNDLGAVVTLVARGLACGAAGEERGILRSIETAARFYRNEFQASAIASEEAVRLLPRGHRRWIRSLTWSTYTAMHLGKGVEADAQLREVLATDPAPGDRASYARSLGDVFLSYMAIGKRRQAHDILLRIESIEATLAGSDPLARAHARYWRVRFIELLGDDPHAALVAARESVTNYEVSGDRRMLACAMVEVGDLTRRLSSVADGVAIMRPAVALATELREPVITAFVMHYLALLLAEHGAEADLPEATALARRVLEIVPVGIYHAFGQFALALALLRQGDREGAEAQAAAARATLRRVGLRAYYPHADAVLLQVTAEGDPAAGAALADEALREVDDDGPRGLFEMTLRLTAARAHLRAARRDDARRGVTRALEGLARRAARIPDPALRARFFSDVPEHARLAALAAELGCERRSVG